MATVYYYDASGAKKQTDSTQLPTLVKLGVIKRDTFIENANGVRVQAARVKGLFPDDASAGRQNAQGAASPISTPSSAPTASAARPGSSAPNFAPPPPPFGSSASAAPSGGANPFGASSQGGASAFSSGPSGGGVGGGGQHCAACGALLTGAGNFCPKCGTPTSGGAVSYCPACGAQMYAGQAVCTNCGRNANQGGFGGSGVKSKTVAGILALLVGGLGIHKFYLGSWGWGIVYILTCWLWIPSLVALIEGIIYLTMNDYEFQSKYSPATQSAFRW